MLCPPHNYSPSKLPIVTQEPPAPRAKASEPAAVAEPVPMPDPEDYDADGTPF